MGRPDKDYDLDDVWYSVQYRMNGTWITEKTKLDEWEDAWEFVEWLRKAQTHKPRVRINRHEVYREEV